LNPHYFEKLDLEGIGEQRHRLNLEERSNGNSSNGSMRLSNSCRDKSLAKRREAQQITSTTILPNRKINGY
jgi:hypothetical protein